MLFSVLPCLTHNQPLPCLLALFVPETCKHVLTSGPFSLAVLCLEWCREQGRGMAVRLGNGFELNIGVRGRIRLGVHVDLF